MFKAVRLPLGRSRRLLVLLCFVHLVALLSVVSLSISGYERGLMTIAVFASLVYTMRQHYFRTSSRSVRAVVMKVIESRAQQVDTTSDDKPEQTWLLELSSDQTGGHGQFPQHPARLVGNYLVTPWLVLLNFKVEGRLLPLPVLLFSDSTDPEKLRRLRVLLLH